MKRTPQKYTGSAFIITSAFFFGTYGIWSKLMVGSFGEFNQAWTRALILLCVLVPFGIWTKAFRKIAPQDRIWFAVIAVCGAFNQAPYFYGFEHLQVGTATLLFYSMLTVGAYVIGKLFFNEKITPIKYISLFLAVVGLGIIYRFTLSPAQILPALSTMVAGLMGAACVVFSKKLSSNYSETQILTVIFILMIISNLVVSLVIGETLPPLAVNAVWLAQLGYAAAMLLANATVIAGFRHLEPSIGGLLGLLEVIFGALFGIFLFHEVLSPNLIFGSTIILAAAALPDVQTFFKSKNLV